MLENNKTISRFEAIYCEIPRYTCTQSGSNQFGDPAIDTTLTLMPNKFTI